MIGRHETRKALNDALKEMIIELKKLNALAISIKIILVLILITLIGGLIC